MVSEMLSSAVRCWRCKKSTPDVQRIAHPDPAADTRVPVCADGCCLPADILYRCHRCDENHDRAAIHLVVLPNRNALAPECLDCNRAGSG